jgi:hypothetical protein
VIELLSSTKVNQQVSAEAATWLDKKLAAGQSTALRDSVSARRHERACQCRQWLLNQGLSTEAS